MIRAARYLGVAPWDLAGKPVWWLECALAAQGAERAAEEKSQAKANRRRRMGGGA